jgi:hypothetical protein
LAPIARDVISRALHRPVLVLGLSALVAGAVVAQRALRTPVFLATIHLRIAEGELPDPTHGPRPPRAIRDYIRNIALSRDRVERILKEHRWASAYLARNREQAIEDFRDDVEIEVSRNYFIFDNGSDAAPRSARVAISLRASDGSEALAALHQIGDAILEDQAAYRRSHATGSRAFVEAQIQGTRSRVRSIQELLERSQPGGAGSNPARMAALRVEASTAAEQLVQLERLAASLSFSAAAEESDLGLTLERYDESVAPSGLQLPPIQLAGLGTLVFAIATVGISLAVGSFDDRIYATADLATRGLPIFGTLPRFPGDDVWPYRSRSGPREG